MVAFPLHQMQAELKGEVSQPAGHAHNLGKHRI
jgi:hypothetical protein